MEYGVVYVRGYSFSEDGLRLVEEGKIRFSIGWVPISYYGMVMEFSSPILSL